MEQKQGISQIISEYQKDVEALSKYLNWLDSKRDEKMYTSYSPEDATASTMKFPVYDSTLLAFINVAKNTKFLNRNYVYTYSQKKIKNAQDEHKVIDAAQITEMTVLGDILSKYVLKGMTKGTVWSEGVSNGVFYHVVKQMKDLIEFWSVPM